VAGVLIVTLVRIVRLMRIVSLTRIMPLMFILFSIRRGWHIRMSHICVRVMT